jgi:protein SCO1/2
MIRRLSVICLSAALLAATLTGCSSSPSTPPKPAQLNDRINSSGPYQGVGLDPAQPRPSFTLTDTSGQPFAFQQRTAGHPTLLFFGYTNCPDVCPATMADVHIALTKLPQSLQQKVYVVFVSTDVQRDTAAVLTKWLGNFDQGVGATFVGLRGTQQEIDAAQASAHVTVAEDGGQTHSAAVLLFGADDYARVVYPQSTDEAQQMAHDLPLVAGV